MKVLFHDWDHDASVTEGTAVRLFGLRNLLRVQTLCDWKLEILFWRRNQTDRGSQWVQANSLQSNTWIHFTYFILKFIFTNKLTTRFSLTLQVKFYSQIWKKTNMPEKRWKSTKSKRTNSIQTSFLRSSWFVTSSSGFTLLHFLLCEWIWEQTRLWFWH